MTNGGSTMPNQKFTTDHEREAYRLGVEAAVAAASWVLDGNMSQDHIRRMVAWLDDGDPRADDFLPAMPDLSGEWADGPTPDSLAVGIVGAPDLGCGDAEEYDELRNAIADAWEAGVSDTFRPECERVLRGALEDAPMTREQGIAFLIKDGPHLATPGSRYGRDAEACAPVAWRVAEIVADATGEAVTEDDLDYAMGLVVNDSDDVESLLREHGTPEDLELLPDVEGDDTSEEPCTEHGFDVCPDCGNGGTKIGSTGYVPCARFLTCWADLDDGTEG
jgi:hypothetical protein